MPSLTVDRRTAHADGSPVTTSPARLDSLTGLRWFAALYIFLYHFAYEADFYGTPERVDWMRYYFGDGPTAVSFFFVLSGFVLAWTHRPNDTRRGFWRRRFARIYPAHLATFLVALAFLPVLGQSFSWKATLANLTLTQSWFPDGGRIWYAYNGVSWSLACEFFFYLAFPFLARVLSRFSVRGWALIGAACCLFVVLLPFTIGFGWEPKYVLYVLPATRLPDFVLGICLAFIVKSGRWRGPGMLLSLALCAFALFWVAHWVPGEFDLASVTVIPYALLIAAAASADLRGRFSLLRVRGVVYLGEISFCFYLVHELVVFLADHAMAGVRHTGTVPDVIAVGCVALVGAVLLHEFVEKPGVRLLSGRRGMRTR